jgi:hypothetical protein
MYLDFFVEQHCLINNIYYNIANASRNREYEYIVSINSAGKTYPLTKTSLSVNGIFRYTKNVAPQASFSCSRENCCLIYVLPLTSQDLRTN